MQRILYIPFDHLHRERAQEVLQGFSDGTI
jgi:hypothetical protein